MKAKCFFSIFILLLFFFSCNEEDQVIISDGTVANSSLTQAKLTIRSMGLDTTSIFEWNNYYIVEGDILLCKDSLDAPKPSTRQYRTTYYVNNMQTITIGVDNTIALNTDWREAVKEVIEIYNESSGLNFIYNENNPDIKITKSNISNLDVCASGEFPSSSKRPGKIILINSNFYVNIDTFLDLSEKVFLLMHELGHNLGLRHTNGFSEGDAGFGLIQIPGTPTSDPNSYMNSSTCGRSWSGFSDYDSIALGYLWPIQFLVIFSGYDSEFVIPNSFISRSFFPTSNNSIFSGWYKDSALTIPWNYDERVTSDITLYPKWRPRVSATTIQKSSDTSSSLSFTVDQTTGVSVTAKVGCGLNNWWDISKYQDKTFAILGKTSSTIKVINMDQYIWNMNPETYIEHTENIVLDPGTYWLAAQFAPALGPQYGASYKHGVTYAIVSY